MPRSRLSRWECADVVCEQEAHRVEHEKRAECAQHDEREHVVVARRCEPGLEEDAHYWGKSIFFKIRFKIKWLEKEVHFSKY